MITVLVTLPQAVLLPTVQHCYNEHIYDEFTITVKSFLFPVVLKHMN